MMNNIPVSLFLGPLFLVVFFLICLTFVAGIKLLYYYFKRTPEKLKPKNSKSKKPKTVKNPPSTVRSIEINPDEIDKIYVKKAS